MIRLYVRELREVGGVEIQRLRQPLHQLGGLGGGEGPGGRETGGSHGSKPIKTQFFRKMLAQFETHKWVIALRPRLCLPCTHVHTNARAGRKGRTQTQTNAHGAAPRETGSAASSGLLNHLRFFKP